MSKELLTFFKNISKYDKTNPINEVEISVYNENKTSLDYYSFKRILERLVLSKENNGLGLSFDRKTILDIIMDDNIRIQVSNQNDIKKLWLKDELKEVKHHIEKKIKPEKLDLEEYNIRLRLASEIELKDKKQIETIIDNANSSLITKTYRYKNRYAIQLSDLFRIDCTSVKTSRGTSFKNSKVLKKNESFEIEIEYIGEISSKKDNIEKLSKQIDNIIKFIISLRDGTNFVISNDEKESVIDTYISLINSSTYKGTRKSILSNKNLNFISANPVTLQMHNLNEKGDFDFIYKNYAVSPKADGVRHLLLVLDKKVYAFNNNFQIIYTGNTSKNENSLLEGEYINDINLFLVYDCLFADGNDIRRTHYNKRVEKIDEILENIKQEENGIGIKKKLIKFGDGDDMKEIIKDMWESRKDLDYYVDGLIFTPVRDYYPPNGGTWTKLLKWKPDYLNSIDFLVKTEKDDKGKDIIRPYVSYESQKKILKKQEIQRVQQYKTLILFVSANKDRFDNKTKSWKKKRVPVEFNPLGKDKNAMNEISRAKVLLDENMNMIAHDPLSDELQNIFDDTIVEIAYDKTNLDFKWKILRVREDKTYKYKNGESQFGNDEKTANNIWENIQKPVTFEMLTTGDIPDMNLDAVAETQSAYYKGAEQKIYLGDKRLPFQKFHNLIKRNIIVNYSPAHLEGVKQQVGSLLDLASGKSGDLRKWKDAYLKRVVGMDIDKAGIEYGIKYYKTMPRPKPNVYLAWGDASKLIFPDYAAGMNTMEKERLKEYIPSKYEFDIVSMQFAVHYMFDSEISLRTFIQNVSDNLKVGGYLVGTCFDGRRIFNLLKGKKKVEGKFEDRLIWSIERDYRIRSFAPDKPMYGKKIKVFVESIGVVHEEYLVNFEYFIQLMAEYGFEKVEVNGFGDLYNEMEKNNKYNKNALNLSDVEKEFSFLNNAFVFRKAEQAPDFLYEKLNKLIKKEDKKKKKEEEIKGGAMSEIENKELEEDVKTIQISSNMLKTTPID
jgi:hypothetical protein